MNRSCFFALSSLLLLVSLSSCASHMSAPAIAGASLPKLMAERLSWMDQVAQFKLAKGLPVNDPKRELELLVAMKKAGAEAGIPAAPTVAFFKGQMQAAKTRQEEWLSTHSAAGQKDNPVPDLAHEIRPALDTIGKTMVKRLAEARASKQNDGMISATRMELVKAGCSQAVVTQALQGLEAGLK